jgi:phosphoribosylformylglycinamidine synthase
MVKIEQSPSILFRDMLGAELPIAVAHGEGRAEFAEGALEQADASQLIAGRFVTGSGETALRYPENPNGSPLGITALTTPDGRTTIMMPHPERVFRNVQYSWAASGASEDAPWMRLFRNARLFVG